MNFKSGMRLCAQGLFHARFILLRPLAPAKGHILRIHPGLTAARIRADLRIAVFIEGGAVQCGFCTPGMLISAYSLLLKNPNPTRDEIRLAMSGNLCRCTGYVPIIAAIENTAKEM